MPTPESLIKKRIIDELEKRGACCLPIPGGEYGRPGSPDYVVCYKGHYIGMEGKTYRGRQTEDQKAVQEDIESAGGTYILGKCWEKVLEVIDEIDRKKGTN